MDKKYQIFISSTYVDLIEERKKVRDTILSMLHFPVGMEIFGAADEEQWEIIKDTIDSSDYYVLLVGHRYGSVITEGPDAGISYTEKEFRYAREKNIPILAFIIDDSVAVTPDKMEKSNPDKLKAFKADVKTGRLVEWWKNPDDLAQKVSISLHKQMDRKKRPGWVRADSFDIEESHAELIALNKRVRELEEENHQLRSKTQTRVPKLKVSFELDTPDKDDDKPSPLFNNSVGAYTNPDGGLTIKVPRVNEEGISELRSRYSPLSIEDVPEQFKGEITQRDIDKYNNGLPKDGIVDRFIDTLRAYKKIRLGVATKCWIYNEGTAKANDVTITIKAPQGLLLLEFEDVDDMKEPKAPGLPENPIQAAYEKSFYVVPSSWQKLFDTTQLSVIPDISALQSYRPIMSIGNNIKIENNTAEISLKSILHTQKDYMQGCYFVAVEPGVYEVECSIMCAEYLEPDIQYIKIYAE